MPVFWMSPALSQACGVPSFSRACCEPSVPFCADTRSLFLVGLGLNPGPLHCTASPTAPLRPGFTKFPKLGVNLWSSCLSLAEYWDYRPIHYSWPEVSLVCFP